MIDLYSDEQINVVSAKLTNFGFHISESTPDYTFEGLDYHDMFTVLAPYCCGSTYDIIQNGFIEFKRIGYGSYDIVYIDFGIYMPNPKGFMLRKAEEWKKVVGAKVWVTEKSLLNGHSYVGYSDTTIRYYESIEEPGSAYQMKGTLDMTLDYSNIPNILCPNGEDMVYGKIHKTILKFPIADLDAFFTNANSNEKIITVPVKKQGNTYLVEIRIGGKSLLYTIDSGASEMVITTTILKDLMDQGIVRNTDFLPEKTFILADGSEKEYRRVMIPVISIGTNRLTNVVSVIAEDGNPLLLGKSFLDKFRTWKINNSTLTLELTL
jgi:clan AA aspartic protease (TIGR02281 family)